MASKNPNDPTNLIQELNLSRKKIQILENAFNDLLEELTFSKKLFPQQNDEKTISFFNILDDLSDEIRMTSKQIKTLDNDLGGVIDGLFEGERGDQVRETIVRVMNLCLSHWEATTESTKIELAEESKLWKVNIDQGVLRVRTFDRYLDLKKLPKNPKWKDVLRTARFVLNHSTKASSVRDELDSTLHSLQNLIFKAKR